MLPIRQREFVSGDLREEYAKRRTEGRRFAADVWYAREVIRSIRPWAAGWVGDWLRGRPRHLATVGVFRPRAGVEARLDAVARNVRFASRAMRRRPGHASLIALTLAAGIGATTAIFTIVDHVLLRPLPYDRPDELVMVWNTYPGWQGHEVLDKLWDRISLSYPEYARWREEQTSFEAVAIYGTIEATLTGRGDPTLVTIGRHSASLWSLLGVTTTLGRMTADGESGPGAPAVALLGHEIWTRRWGGDPGVVGTPVRLADRAYTVIGVLPPRLRFLPVGETAATDRIDIWIPVGADGAGLDDRGHHVYQGIARLGEAGLTPAAIHETRQLVTGARGSSWSRDVRITPRREEEVGGSRGPLLLLSGAVAILMLIACVNVATLFLGSVTGRRAELATKAALGAARRRLVSQLTVEALTYGVLGIVGGVVLGTWALKLLIRWAPPDLAMHAGIGLDLRILVFASGLGLLTSLVFGLLPAFLLRRLDLQGELRRSPGRSLAGGWKAQRVLVGAQFGLSVILVIGTGLLARSLAAEVAVDPGFESDGLLAIDVTLPAEAYPTSESRSAFVRSVADRVAAVPGVTAVTGVSALPFSGRGGSSSFDIRGREVPDGEKGPEALRRSVLPGFHEALGVQLLEGRTIESADRDGTPPVIVVSRAMADQFWPGRSPIGEFIVRDGQDWEIVGVVADVLTEDLKTPSQPMFYTPFHQEEPGWRSSLSLVVRAAANPGSLIPEIRHAVWELDGALALDRVESVPSLLAGATAAQRYRTFLLSLFAGLATLLSAVGVFGVVARSLLNRTRDLGIRLALGAVPRRLITQEMGRELVVVGVGVFAGLAVAAACAGLLRRFLYGISAHDPMTYVVTVALLIGLGALATYIATRRIVSLDPASVLRAD
jgi:predicted permease